MALDPRLAALWPASYKGVPFYVEKDALDTGRRIVVHEFANSDEPYIEDLGLAARNFQVSLYLVGDSYDVAAAAALAALTSGGPGPLVLPLDGIVQAWLKTCTRDRTLDRTGYIGFRAHFYRDGSSAALASAGSLAQLVYDAVAAAGIAMGAALAALALTTAPGWVVDQIVAQLQDGVAGLDAIRSGSAVAATSSSLIAAQFQILYNAIPALVGTAAAAGDPPLPAPGVTAAVALDDADGLTLSLTTSAAGQTTAAFTIAAPFTTGSPVGATVAAAVTVPSGASPLTAGIAPLLTALAVTLVDAMDANDAGSALMAAFDAVAPAPLPAAGSAPSVLTAALSARVTGQAVRLALLTAYAEAVVNATYSDRQQAISARADLVMRFDAVFEQCGGAANIDLYIALQNLRAAAVNYLSTLITSLAAVVTVTAPRSMPSLWWAWRLYQDPTRAADLIARNDVAHPSFMPEQFEALTPSAATLLPTTP